MSSNNLTPIDIASYVSASALAASKLISVCKPLWNRLPKWLAVLLPVLVLALPQIAQFFAGAKTSSELLAAFVTSLALLMPGLAEAEGPTKTSVDPVKGAGGGLTDVNPFTSGAAVVEPSPPPEG